MTPKKSEEMTVTRSVLETRIVLTVDPSFLRCCLPKQRCVTTLVFYQARLKMTIGHELQFPNEYTVISTKY